MGKRGMAIIIVLGFSTILFILGAFYVKRFLNSGAMNPIMLRRIQVFHFGEGMQKIALLKFKMLPTDFYHAYKYECALSSGTPGLTNYSPSPLEAFQGDANLTGTSTLRQPLDNTISTYSVSYSMAYNSQYKKDIVLIKVTVGIVDEKNSKLVSNYSSQTIVNASRTRSLTF
ncbi:MAG: hypothetical protein HQM08_03775 [Candidatus Riflebacteria bacterium]|nr:hypothetical protein [Candidatus Riflebacteria bacterium]